MEHIVLISKIIIGFFVFLIIWSYLTVPWGAPFVPTPWGTARKMLKMAEIKPDELVIDLGAGDGRMVILAARQYNAQAIGVEIDPVRCFLANVAIRVLGIQKEASIHRCNMYAYDLQNADVVLLYLLQKTNQRLKEKLIRELKPGARVVSHTFTMTDWVPVAIDEKRKLFLYEIGKTGDDVRTEFI